MKMTSLSGRITHRRWRFALILTGALAAFFFASSPVRAGVQPQPFQDWSDAFLLRGVGGTENPLVRFGFNPFASSGVAPGEYPADPVMPSTTPTIIVDVPDGTDLLTGFEILFAMDESLAVRAPGEPDEKGGFAFQLLGATGGVAFDVLLDITTSSGGVVPPGTWTFFNPQPEPPAFGDGAAAAGFAFQLSSFSEATVVMQITDSQGNFLSFVDVHEPTTLALMGLGLAGLGFSKRRSEVKSRGL